MREVYLRIVTMRLTPTPLEPQSEAKVIGTAYKAHRAKPVFGRFARERACGKRLPAGRSDPKRPLRVAHGTGTVVLRAS